MRESGLIIVRTAIVFLFLLGMPIAALPRVQQAISRGAAERSQTTITAATDSTPPRLRIAGEFELPPVTHQVELPVVAEPESDAGTAEELESLKQELIACGATSMVLDRVGVDGGRYRFTCELPVAVGSPYRRQYHAVESDPEAAMTEVLAEVQRTASAGGSALPRPTVRLR